MPLVRHLSFRSGRTFLTIAGWGVTVLVFFGEGSLGCGALWPCVSVSRLGAASCTLTPLPHPRSPADRRPDVPPTLVAQPGAALAGRGQSSPLRGCSTSPQPLDREPLLQDAAAPRGCRRPRRPPLCVPRGRGWERGRRWQLCGLPPPDCSPLGLPPLWLPTHATQRSVSRPQHHWGCLPSLLLRRGGCGPGGGQGRRQIPGVTDRKSVV